MTNFLVIIGDDMGWADLSCYGSSHIRTPNLDRLAAEGVRFTDGYSASPVCTPTRLALYTGRHPQRERVGLKGALLEGNVTDGLEPGVPTLASLLGTAGHTTAMYGKWHVGAYPTFGPRKSGWQEFWGNHNGNCDYFSKITPGGKDDLYENETPQQATEEYYTDLIADRGVDFIRREHTRPWLLNLNFLAGHWPWEAPGDLEKSRWRSAAARAGINNFAMGGSRKTYRAMIESLDANVGRVLAALRETGQDRDTVMLFFADNGGERWSEFGPFQGGKGDLYEGGTRVCTILRWTGHLRPGQVSDTPVITQDWTATLLEIAGVAPERPLDGRSLAGHLLRGEQAPQEALFWRHNTGRALRSGRWKYHRTLLGVDRLIDLKHDVREERNMAAAQPDRMAELRRDWEEIDATLLH